MELNAGHPPPGGVSTREAVREYARSCLKGLLVLAASEVVAVLLLLNEAAGVATNTVAVAVFTLGALVAPFWAFRRVLEQREAWKRRAEECDARMRRRLPVAREQLKRRAFQFREWCRRGCADAGPVLAAIDAAEEEIREILGDYEAGEFRQFCINMAPIVSVPAADVEGGNLLIPQRDKLGKIADCLRAHADSLSEDTLRPAAPASLARAS
jgi:hypothetical protein